MGTQRRAVKERQQLQKHNPKQHAGHVGIEIYFQSYDGCVSMIGVQTGQKSTRQTALIYCLAAHQFINIETNMFDIITALQ